jgi:hypothetical protein
MPHMHPLKRLSSEAIAEMPTHSMQLYGAPICPPWSSSCFRHLGFGNARVSPCRVSSSVARSTLPCLQLLSQQINTTANRQHLCGRCKREECMSASHRIPPSMSTALQVIDREVFTRTEVSKPEWLDKSTLLSGHHLVSTEMQTWISVLRLFTLSCDNAFCMGLLRWRNMLVETTAHACAALHVFCMNSCCSLIVSLQPTLQYIHIAVYRPSRACITMHLHPGCAP